jgi:tripartite-type tricarboxylate transporter receptor subunit TctC
MRLLHTASIALLSLLVAAPAAKAQMGDRPIRIVSPYAAGDVGDGLARLMAESMRIKLKRPVIVENKTGAGGRLGVQHVKEAPADGDTILITPFAPMAIFPHVYDKLGYNPATDFHPISQVASFDFAVAVSPLVPVRTLPELIAWLKANPEKANFGTPSAGTIPHFFALLFAKTAKLELRHVPYKGNPPAITDLAGGHISMLFTSTQSLVEAHKAGLVRVLATSGSIPSSVMPEVPTFKAAGIDIQGEGWYGIYAPINTPADKVALLNEAVVAAIRTPEVTDRMKLVGLKPMGTSANDLARAQQADSAFWEPIIKQSGFKAE